LPIDYADEVEFYDPDRYMRAAPLRDNILFGRIAYGVANAQPKIIKIGRMVLSQLGLNRFIYGLGLDFEVGKGGKLLQAAQRTKVALARALVGHPDILVLENALALLSANEAEAVLERLRGEFKGRTLITTLGHNDDTEGFDRIIRFEGARIVTREVEEPAFSS
jgi:putative ABC transport system ATP-binding protein